MKLIRWVKEIKLVFWWPFLAILGNLWVKLLVYQFPQLDKCDVGLLIMCFSWADSAYVSFNPLIFITALVFPRPYSYLNDTGWEVALQVGLYIGLGYLTDRYILKSRKSRIVALGMLITYWLYVYGVKAVQELGWVFMK